MLINDSSYQYTNICRGMSRPGQVHVLQYQKIHAGVGALYAILRPTCAKGYAVSHFMRAPCCLRHMFRGPRILLNYYLLP